MFTSQLEEALRKNYLTAPVFARVCGANEVPKQHPPPDDMKRVYIINTQPTTHPGEHWIAVYLAPDKTVYYFDPYGIKPHPNIKLNTFKKIIVWPRRLQGFEQTCGLYCMFFVLHVAGHFDFDIFGDDLWFNDRLVRKLASQHFRWGLK